MSDPGVDDACAGLPCSHLKQRSSGEWWSGVRKTVEQLKCKTAHRVANHTPRVRYKFHTSTTAANLQCPMLYMNESKTHRTPAVAQANRCGNAHVTQTCRPRRTLCVHCRPLVHHCRLVDSVLAAIAQNAIWCLLVGCPSLIPQLLPKRSTVPVLYRYIASSAAASLPHYFLSSLDRPDLEMFFILLWMPVFGRAFRRPAVQKVATTS